MHLDGILRKISVIQYVELHNLLIHVTYDIQLHDRCGEMDIIYGELIIYVRVEVNQYNVAVQNDFYGMELDVVVFHKIYV